MERTSLINLIHGSLDNPSGAVCSKLITSSPFISPSCILSEHPSPSAIKYHSDWTGISDVKFYRARQALSPDILDKYLLSSFHNDTELFHSIVSTVTESIITIYKSSLAKEVQNNTNILKRKLYLDIDYDSVGQNPTPVISPNVIQYISQMTETFVTMKMTQENIWEDYVRWHWNISVFWAMRIMEERYGYNHMLMESKSWDKALDQIICRADANRTLQQLEAYRQKLIEAFLTIINLSDKSLTEMEFLMGLDRIDSYFNKRGSKLIPERSGFLTTFSGVLYQGYRSGLPQR